MHDDVAKRRWTDFLRFHYMVFPALLCILLGFMPSAAIAGWMDDAATRYFERKTVSKLTKTFSPIVHRELNRSGAVKSYRAFSSQYASLPFVGQRLKIDLDEYVTKKALAAMFTVLAHEEAKIRHDPAARTTQLLRRVFR